MRYTRRDRDREMEISSIILTLFIVILIFVAVMFSATDDSRKFNRHEWTIEHHYIVSGDTYWDIARENCPNDIDLRYYIQRVKELNEATSDTLISGHHILIYVENKR